MTLDVQRLYALRCVGTQTKHILTFKQKRCHMQQLTKKEIFSLTFLSKRSL